MSGALAARPGTGWARRCAILPATSSCSSRYGVAVDWPFGYKDLEPWYLAAEQALGVAGDNGVDFGDERSGSYPLPPLPLTYLDRQDCAGRSAPRHGSEIDAAGP